MGACIVGRIKRKAVLLVSVTAISGPFKGQARNKLHPITDGGLLKRSWVNFNLAIPNALTLFIVNSVKKEFMLRMKNSFYF